MCWEPLANEPLLSYLNLINTCADIQAIPLTQRERKMNADGKVGCSFQKQMLLQIHEEGTLIGRSRGHVLEMKASIKF